MITVQKRRRIEGKTDYRARKSMLQSGINRVIFRKTTRYIIGQVLESFEAHDKVVASYNSKELLGNSWPKEMEGSLKSLPAAYLTGFMLGKEAIKAKVKKGILDLGLNRNVPKSRIYAFVAGLKESGFEIPVNEKMLPSKERIEGKHMEKDLKTIIEKITGQKIEGAKAHETKAPTKTEIKVTSNKDGTSKVTGEHKK